MNLKSNKFLLASSSAFVALTMFTSPVLAQQNRRGQDNQNGRGGETRQAGPRDSGSSARGGESQRDDNSRRPAVQRDRRQAPRSYIQGRYDARRVPGRFVRPGYSISRYQRPIFARPYYAFRPRFTFSFGWSSGYPVAFPRDYYSYPESGYVFTPGYGSGYSTFNPRYSGGVSFDVDPYDADVFVDGAYAGAAEDFSPTEPPLTLAAGRHHVEFRSRGFQTIGFDITVIPGQVIPYQGTLPELR